MVTQVTLGNFFTLSNGKTVLGGTGGSGLDTDALLQSLTEAKRLPATRNKDEITLNDKKTGAFAKFQSLLSAFKSSADALRNPPGVGNEADNVFKFTTPTLSALGSNYVSVSTSAGAALQSYQISDISSIATPARQASGTFTVASADTNVVGLGAGTTFAAGTFNFGGQDITIAAGDTLNGIAAKFNAVSDTTGISASVIAIDATHYQLSFVANDTGDASNFDLSLATDPSGVLDDVGLTVPTSGTNAAFKLNGVDIERQNNIISDVISGVTFTLLQTTPDAVTPYTVTVKPDTAIIQTVINNFISNYNALKTFEAEQTRLNSDGTYAEGALLVNNQTFLSIMNNINAQVNGKVAGIAGSNPSSLVDVGISFTNQPASDDTPEVNNILTVNDGALTSALTSNFNGVARLFGFYLGSDNANLTIFTHNNSLTVSSLTLTIDPDAATPVFQATYNLGAGPVTVDMTAVPLGGGVNGYTLKGPSGSAIEGLELIYASVADATIHVTLTQGISDKLFNTSSAALTANTGAIALELTSIKDSNTRLDEEIANINAQVEVFQDQLIARFSALEQAISRVNSLLSSLNANDNQRYAASQ